MVSRLLSVVTVSAVLVLQPLRADYPKPTREAFLAEVLDAKPTPVTPRFNDYTPGSYHVEKEDLLKGLVDEAKKRKLLLRSVSVVGPMPGDPLWTSYVVVHLQEGEKLRVNSLVMPHARITGKATGLIAADEYEKWLEGVQGAGVLQKESPAPAGATKKVVAGPYSAMVLLVTWSKDGTVRELFHGNVGLDNKAEKLFELYNGVLKGLKKTYPEADK